MMPDQPFFLWGGDLPKEGRGFAKPFVIAEMSGNHGGSLDAALALVDAIAESGANALKLQTYTADSMTLDVDRPEFVIQNPESLWFGRRLHDLYAEAYTPWEWQAVIMERARDRGLVCFSSVFDASSVDFLETLDVPLYKIASFESVDLPLIRYTASTGKPLIISTGMATLEEISEAVDAARSAGCENLALLKCTSSYPADPSEAFLLTIPDMQARFGCEVGLSDHTLGSTTAVAAVALGASIVEKHVTISRADGGVDSAFSCEPDELAELVSATKVAWQARGSVRYGPSDSEMPGRLRRRSLYFVEDLSAGEYLSLDSIRSVRPGHGLAPKYLDDVIGRRLVSDVRYGDPVTWECLE